MTKYAPNPEPRRTRTEIVGYTIDRMPIEREAPIPDPDAEGERDWYDEHEDKNDE
jgi:hypothetical protein